MQQHMMSHIAHIMHIEAIELLKLLVITEPSCLIFSIYICIVNT